jgi:hypothetical protein
MKPLEHGRGRSDQALLTQCEEEFSVRGNERR